MWSIFPCALKKKKKGYVKWTSWNWLLEGLPCEFFFSYLLQDITGEQVSFPSPNSEFEVSQVLVFKLLLQEKSTRRQHFLWPHLSSSGNQSPRENLFQSCLVTSSPLTCTPRRNPKPSPNCDAECAVVLRWEDCQEGGCWWEPPTGVVGGQGTSLRSQPKGSASFESTGFAWAVGGRIWIWRLGFHP